MFCEVQDRTKTTITMYISFHFLCLNQLSGPRQNLLEVGCWNNVWIKLGAAGLQFRATSEPKKKNRKPTL